MKNKGENIVASVRQKLINLSKERGEDPNLILIQYGIERFLYRLSRSKQSDKFILKGAMLWAVWTGKSHRPTKDLDLLGYGDSIIPAPKEITYPTLLDMPAPQIKTYSIETFVAEKLETIVSKGIANSRMKDFYDLKILSQKFEFNGDNLSNAIISTFERRSTNIPTDRPIAFTEEFHSNQEKQQQWQAFLRTNKLEDANIELRKIVKDIESFLLPPLIAIAEDNSFTEKWHAGGYWK